MEIPEAKAGGFADDTGAQSNSVACLQEVLNLTGIFAMFTGQDLSGKKSKCWATTTELRTQAVSLSVGGEALELVRSMRMLGAHLHFARGEQNATGIARAEQGKSVASPSRARGGNGVPGQPIWNSGIRAAAERRAVLAERGAECDLGRKEKASRARACVDFAGARPPMRPSAGSWLHVSMHAPRHAAANAGTAGGV